MQIGSIDQFEIVMEIQITTHIRQVAFKNAVHAC